MCLGAIYWAHIDRIYYANNRKDAGRIGFDDDFIYRELEVKNMADRHTPIIHLPLDSALQVFRDWDEKKDKTEY